MLVLSERERAEGPSLSLMFATRTKGAVISPLFATLTKGNYPLTTSKAPARLYLP
jgi:hypothetical protein